MRVPAIVVLALLVLAAPAQAARHDERFLEPSPHGIEPRGLALRLIQLPSWLLTLPLRPFIREAEREVGTSLAREDGWSRIGFPMRDRGLGVYLEVAGRAQLGRVEIVFEDGAMQQVELERGNVYRRGLYRIASFDGDREVMLVRMEARACTPRAAMRVLLAR